MKIVVCGAGKIGETICQVLSAEHDIILIDQDVLRLEQLIGSADITGVIGQAEFLATQQEAEVDSCDIFIAVMPSDDANLIACITARTLGAKHTVCRVRDPEYTNQINFFRDTIGIDTIINPELSTARYIARMIQLPEAVTVESFVNGKLNIVNFHIPDNGFLDGLSLVEFRRQFPELLVCAIKRNEKIIIPSGQDMISRGDNIYLTGKLSSIRSFFQKTAYQKKQVHSVMVVGAGRITRYLIPFLKELKIDIKVIEANSHRAELLAAEHPSLEIICGDGTDQYTLEEEHLDAYDAVVALTGIDEENLLLALYADRQRITKPIAKVNRTNLLRILEIQDRLSTVTPNQIIANKIVRYVRAVAAAEHSEISGLYRLVEGAVEMIQLTVDDSPRSIGIPLKNLTSDRNTLVGVIIRKHQLIFPTGEDSIQKGDTVLIITTKPDISNLDDMFIGEF